MWRQSRYTCSVPVFSFHYRWRVQQYRGGKIFALIISFHESFAAFITQNTAIAAYRFCYEKEGDTPGSYKAVGWNCMNSMFSIFPFARYTIAIPSPVAMRGLVVVRYAWPQPPVASKVIFANIFSICWYAG
jgi:hypothetical protein